MWIVTGSERFTQLHQPSRILVIQLEDLSVDAITHPHIRELLTGSVLRWQQSQRRSIMRNIRNFITDTRFVRKNRQKALPTGQNEDDNAPLLTWLWWIAGCLHILCISYCRNEYHNTFFWTCTMAAWLYQLKYACPAQITSPIFSFWKVTTGINCNYCCSFSYVSKLWIVLSYRARKDFSGIPTAQQW